MLRKLLNQPLTIFIRYPSKHGYDSKLKAENKINRLLVQKFILFS